MGSALGSNPAALERATRWVVDAAAGRAPVWVKLTPNVGDIAACAAAALDGGAQGVALINTINCIAGVDLTTLAPTPSVLGRTTPGGYSGPAVKPIALAKVAAVAGEVGRRGGGVDVVGMGGIEDGSDAAEFMLLGSHAVQACTGVRGESGCGEWRRSRARRAPRADTRPPSLLPFSLSRSWCTVTTSCTTWPPVSSPSCARTVSRRRPRSSAPRCRASSSTRTW